MPETVLVTGASSGIGLELAKCFAAEKSNLILVARSRAALENLAAEVRQQFSVKAEVLVADLTKPETPAEIFNELTKRKIAVDVLVNNAGFGLHGAFAELPLARQLEIVKVNVSALVELAGLFLPEMLARNRGGVLNVGSVAGFLPGPNMAVYYASKAFVLSFSEALYEEVRGTAVRVTNLCPGPTESNFSQVARAHHARLSRARKMAAAEVAQIGVRDFRAGKCLSFPGIKNEMLSTLAPRILPRSVIRQLTANYNRLK